MQNKNLFILFFTLFLLSQSLEAFYLPQFIVSGDVDYQIIKAENQEVIYAPYHKNDADLLFQKAQDLHSRYEKSFDFTLTQTNYTTLASHQNQVSNGFATFFPLLMNGFYSGGAAGIDYFGSVSWMDALLIHEFAHTYQLDAKSGFSEVLQTIFGNNGAWFINPNYLLPTMILEGNAVMNESRFGLGGRLYVGEHRALVYALSHDGKLDYTRLLNNHIDFPYTREKYLVGGYFWAYVAKRFGTHKANSYFKQHAVHYINPLRINRSFKEHFGISYKTMIHDFLLDLQKQSQAMHFLEGEELSFAHYIGDLNADDHEIFWMHANESGSNKKNIFVKSGKFATQESSLAIDKLFKIKGDFYTSTQAQTDASHIDSGLFDKDLKMQAASKDFFLFDRRGDAEVGFYIPDSYSRAQLYKNRTFFAQADSSAILDQEGNVYYAKQHDTKRQLYKNSEGIASWKGYSQKLLEVKGDKVFFIAPTPYGASLFFAQAGKVYRLSQADNIIDARIIDDTHFLAVTVKGDGYHILKAKLKQAQEETPAWYGYDLESEQLSDIKKHQHSEPKQYNPFSNMHYGFLQSFGYTYSSSGFAGAGLSVMLTDPMHLNEIQLASYLSSEYTYVGALYENRKQLLHFALGGFYDDTFGGLADVALSYPLIQRARTALDARVSAYIFDTTEFGVLASLNYRYGEQYALAYDWHKYRRWDLAYLQHDNEYAASLETEYIFEPWDAFFTKFFAAVHSSDRSIYVRSWSGLSTFYGSYPGYVAVNSNSVHLHTNNIFKTALSESYTFKTGLYFDVWPFSLRRTALGLEASYYALDGEVDSEGNSLTPDAFDFYELKASIDFEVLGFHLAPFNFGLAINYNSYIDDTEYLVQFGVSY